MREIFAERFTISEQLDKIMDAVRTRKQVSFSEVFGGMASRQEIVCTFLALLELIRLKQVAARQDQAFDKVWIVPCEGIEPEADGKLEEDDYE